MRLTIPSVQGALRWAKTTLEYFFGLSYSTRAAVPHYCTAVHCCSTSAFFCNIITVQYCTVLSVQYCTVLYYSELKILATVHIIGTVLNCNELPSSWWRTTLFVTAYPVRYRKSVYDVPP